MLIIVLIIPSAITYRASFADIVQYSTYFDHKLMEWNMLNKYLNYCRVKASTLSYNFNICIIS